MNGACEPAQLQLKTLYSCASAFVCALCVFVCCNAIFIIIYPTFTFWKNKLLNLSPDPAGQVVYWVCLVSMRNLKENNIYFKFNYSNIYLYIYNNVVQHIKNIDNKYT